MVVFNDSLDLRTAVIENSSEQIADIWPRLVAKAENQINRRIRVREMIKNATVTFTDGVAPFPDDYLEIIDLRFDQFNPSNLTSLSDEKNDRYYSDYRSSYAIQNDGFVISGFDGDRNIIYYASAPSIANSLSATNSILSKYPELYEYASTVEAARYLKDLQLLEAYLAFFEEAILTTRQQSNTERFGAAKVRIYGATP